MRLIIVLSLLGITACNPVNPMKPSGVWLPCNEAEGYHAVEHPAPLLPTCEKN